MESVACSRLPQEDVSEPSTYPAPGSGGATSPTTAQTCFSGLSFEPVAASPHWEPCNSPPFSGILNQLDVELCDSAKPANIRRLPMSRKLLTITPEMKLYRAKASLMVAFPFNKGRGVG